MRPIALVHGSGSLCSGCVLSGALVFSSKVQQGISRRRNYHFCCFRFFSKAPTVERRPQYITSFLPQLAAPPRLAGGRLRWKSVVTRCVYESLES